jgi:hypothetical protein
MNAEIKDHLMSFALYLKEQGESDREIIEEISSTYELSESDATEILNSVKNSFSKEIKTSVNSRIYYLIPIFLISLSVFIGWFIISLSENWVFFVGGIYGVLSGALSILSGLSIDMLLKENYPSLRLKLRASFGILFLIVILGYPLYSIYTKQYVLKDKDLLIFKDLVLKDNPNIKYENKLATSEDFNFVDYDETFNLGKSEFKASLYGKLSGLKKGDTIDIFLKKNPKTHGYDKSLFSKKIPVYNIRKGNFLLIDLEKRNNYKKKRILHTLFNWTIFYILIFHFTLKQIQRLKKLWKIRDERRAFHD